MRLVNAPPGAEKIRFKFGGLRIEGASAYNEAQLSSLYKNKIGQEISLADIYAIANQITLKYRNDGYILTQVVVPPQTIESGLPRLQIVEGYINNVTVQADDKESEQELSTIRLYAQQLKDSKATNVKELERELLLINDLPGVRARSVISPSATPGAADIAIIVSRKPYDALLTVDDYGSRYLGPIQFGAAGTLNSLLGFNEQISGQVVQTPQGELSYGGAGYEQPVGPWGTKLSVNYSITDTDPGYDLRQFDVDGRSHLFTVKATHPFLRTRNTNLTGRALLDVRDVKSSNNIEPTRKDHIRALRAGAQYSFLDSLLGVAINTVDAEVSHGLNIFGASDEGDANLTRPDGDPEFTKMNLSLQRLQKLVNNLNLLVAGTGQISNGALLSSEEFGVGGIENGRGYDPSEIVGDEGVSGKLELQWNNPFNTGVSYLNKYQLYSFYDIGAVWNDDATTSAGKRDSLASAGLGARFTFQSNLEGGFAVALPLTRGVQTNNNDTDPKFYFNLSKKF